MLLKGVVFDGMDFERTQPSSGCPGEHRVLCSYVHAHARWQAVDFFLLLYVYTCDVSVGLHLGPMDGVEGAVGVDGP